MDNDPHVEEDLTMRFDRPDDVLAYLPYRFGFVPTEALAVLAVLEPEPGAVSIGLAARLDLADLARPAVLRHAADALSDQLDRDPTVCAFTVVYSDIEPEGVRAGWGSAGKVISEWLARFSYADPSATFLVSPTTFRCWECADQPCCPPGGHPVARLTQTEVAAQMVLAGRSLVGSREDLACPREAPPDRVATAERAAQRERRAMPARSPEQQRRWRQRMLGQFGAALQDVLEDRRGWRADPAMLGRLSAALGDAQLRDAVVAWMVSGRRLPPGSYAVLDAVGGIVDGTLPLPSAQHLAAAFTVMTEVARHTAPGRAGYPLAALAWLSWWRGDGARADVLRAQSMQEDPDNTLGQLLADVLEHGVRPGWALPGASVATPTR